MTFDCRTAIKAGLCKGGIDCCRIVGIPLAVVKKYEHLKQVEVLKVFGDKNDVVYPVTPDKRCVFLNRKSGLCMIYEDRPAVCRHYGRFPEAECPFLTITGRLRTKEEIKKTVEMNKKLIRDKLKFYEGVRL